LFVCKQLEQFWTSSKIFGLVRKAHITPKVTLFCWHFKGNNLVEQWLCLATLALQSNAHDLGDVCHKM
jgi:hypothetical protein